jgi:flagellar biosynthesis anti-sigma factor FlgM
MISGAELTSVLQTYLQRAAQARRSEGAPAAQDRSGSGADGVVFSPHSAAVGRLLAALHELPDVRQDRVAAVRARLESGTSPSPAEVARQILARALGDRLAGG